MNRVFIPGHKYKFQFDYSHPMEYITNELFGENQSRMPGNMQSYSKTGYFISIHNGQYVFCGHDPISINANNELTWRLYFLVDPTNIFDDITDVTMAPVLIESIQYFLSSPYGPELMNPTNTGGYEPYDSEMVIRFEGIFNQIELNKIETMRRKTAVRKLKPFFANILSRPPNKYNNTRTGKKLSWVGPYYQRAANSYAKLVHGSAIRTRKQNTNNRHTRRRR